MRIWRGPRGGSGYSRSSGVRGATAISSRGIPGNLQAICARPPPNPWPVSSAASGYRSRLRLFPLPAQEVDRLAQHRRRPLLGVGTAEGAALDGEIAIVADPLQGDEGRAEVEAAGAGL